MEKVIFDHGEIKEVKFSLTLDESQVTFHLENQGSRNALVKVYHPSQFLSSKYEVKEYYLKSEEPVTERYPYKIVKGREWKFEHRGETRVISLCDQEGKAPQARSDREPLNQHPDVETKQHYNHRPNRGNQNPERYRLSIH